MRILIAEDERITRATLVRQLEGWGHSVVAAEDGEKGGDTGTRAVIRGRAVIR